MTSSPANGSNGASRRDFLKGSTAVMGGALLGGLSLARSAYAGGDDTIKVGLIGCGGRGTGAASQALHTKGPVKLIAMGDAFKDNLERSLGNLQKDEGIKEKIDVPPERRFVGFDAFQQVLAAGPDVVLLATPPGFRPMHFAAAIEAGKHVFMEKPVAVDAPGVRTVLAAAQKAKENNLAVGVGLQRRHQATYLEAVRLLHEGEIGDILTMRVYWNGAKPWVRNRAQLERQKGSKLSEMEYQMRNWYYFNWLCGDHINEQHIHNLDVANWVKQAHPIKAQGMGGCEVRKGPDYGEIFDHHCVEFEYADGSRCFSQCRHIENCWESVSEFAQGTKGVCELSKPTIQVNGRELVKVGGGKFPGNPYQVEHDDFFTAIRAGNPYNEAEIGATSTMTAIMGRMATYSGKLIKWNDALNSGFDLMPKEFSWEATPPVVPGPDGMYPRAIPGSTRVINASV